MKITNRLGLPAAIVEAVTNDPYSPGESDITATKLISSVQIGYLYEQHKNEIVEDASDRLWCLLGQAVHTILERSEHKALTEERLYIERMGWKIGGQFDRLCVLDGALTDYKVTSMYSVKDGPKPEWEQQLNVLAHIVRENGYRIESLTIIAILRDWSKTQAERKADLPQAGAVPVPIPLWSPEQAEEYICQRVMAHQHARKSGVIPPCTPEEMWRRANTWAVRKEGRKTAVRVLTNEQEAGSLAADLGAGHSVEFRPGESIRCKSYCPVAAFCSQNPHKGEVNAEL